MKLNVKIDAFSNGSNVCFFSFVSITQDEPGITTPWKFFFVQLFIIFIDLTKISIHREVIIFFSSRFLTYRTLRISRYETRDAQRSVLRFFATVH